MNQKTTVAMWTAVWVFWIGAAACGGYAAQPGATDPARPPQQAEPNPPREMRPQPGIGGAPGAWTPPKPEVSPIDPGLDVAGAIESAKARAKADGRRVLVIWAPGGASDFTPKLVELTRTNSMRRLLGMEFETVWAAVGVGPKGGDNLALAKSLGASVSAEDRQPTLQVLDADAKSLGVQGCGEFVDAKRPRSYSPIKVESFLDKHKATAPKAQEVLDASLARAKAEGKFVLIYFGEFGDAWTAQFKAWLEEPEVDRVIGRHAVVTQIELARNPGAPELLEKLGGVRVQSLPWFAVAGADGKVLGMSQSEKMPNIGFPTDDGEIGRFLDLLRLGDPKLPEQDAQAIRDSLVEHRTRKR